MARFPDKTALGAGPSLRVDRRLPAGDTVTPVAAGLEALGKAVTTVADTVHAREQAAEKFDAETGLIDFKDRWNRQLAERQRDAAPGAEGFREAVERDFLADADAWIAGLPARLRPAFKLKLREFDDQVMAGAHRFAAQEGARFEEGRIDDAHRKLSAQVTQDPNQLPAVLAQSATVIGTSTRLSPGRKEELTRQWSREFTGTAQRSAIGNDKTGAIARRWTASDAATIRNTSILADRFTDEDIKRFKAEAEAHQKALVAEADESARTFEQDVWDGRRDPRDTLLIAAQYRGLGVESQAKYFGYLHDQREKLIEWATASTDRQRSIVEAEGERLRKVVEDYASETYNDVKKAVASGATVDQHRTQLEEAREGALLAGNKALVAEIDSLASGQRFESSTDEARNVVIQRIRAKLDAKGVPPESFKLLARMEHERQRNEAALKKDSFSAGTARFKLQVQPMPDIARGTAQDVQALQARAILATHIASQEPTVAKTILPFTNDEMAGLTTVIDAAPADQKAKMLGTLSAGLGRQMFGHVMMALRGSGHGALAWAGGNSGVDQNAARTVLQGIDVARTAKDFLLPSGELKRAIDAYVGAAFQESGAARAMVEDAVRAAYTKYAVEEGRKDGKFDTNIAAKAIRLIVGSVVQNREGDAILPPRPDLTIGDFKAVLAALDDDDLPRNLRSDRGDRIDATRVKTFGILSSVGNGRYFVRFRDSDGILKRIEDPDRPGEAWILDLRPVTARVIAGPLGAPARVVATEQERRRAKFLGLRWQKAAPLEAP